MEPYHNLYNELLKQYTSAEIAESFVFPGPTDLIQREVMLSTFMAWREKKMEEQSTK